MTALSGVPTTYDEWLAAYAATPERTASFELQQRIDAGERIVVGVNAHTEGDDDKHPILHIDPALERKQIGRVQAVRGRRDPERVELALADLRAAADSQRNLMPLSSTRPASTRARARSSTPCRTSGVRTPKRPSSDACRPNRAAGPAGHTGTDVRAGEGVCSSLLSPAARVRRIRVVVAKPGLDGHDRGAKIIARALRDAGMEVIYTGLHQTPEQIVETVIQEDADAVGLSILSGAHMTLVPRVVELLREQGIDDVLVTVGGTIPADDILSSSSWGWRRCSPLGRRPRRSSTSSKAHCSERARTTISNPYRGPVIA
jgi:methylmalonyl-CoA mutase cobalamin-binding domain/chain